MFVRLGATRRRALREEQRGAVAVEAALITPLIALLLFGIIEFGLLLNRHLSASNASREGVRSAAASTNDGGMENRVFTRLRDSLTGIPLGAVTRLAVYEADVNGEPLNGVSLRDIGSNPTACAQRCIYWSPSSVSSWDDVAATRAGDIALPPSGPFWTEDLDGCVPIQQPGPPIVIIDNRSRIGVYVELEYDAFTPLIGQIIGNNRKVVDRTTMRVEPARGGVPCA